MILAPPRAGRFFVLRRSSKAETPLWGVSAEAKPHQARSIGSKAPPCARDDYATVAESRNDLRNATRKQSTIATQGDYATVASPRKSLPVAVYIIKANALYIITRAGVYIINPPEGVQILQDIDLATTVFVVAIAMQKPKKSPARGGAEKY